MKIKIIILPDGSSEEKTEQNPDTVKENIWKIEKDDGTGEEVYTDPVTGQVFRQKIRLPD